MNRDAERSPLNAARNGPYHGDSQEIIMRPPEGTLHRKAGATLAAACGAWFGTAVLGQVLFGGYVAIFYVGSALQGRWEDWNKVFPKGHIPGATVSNLAVAVHVLLALVILVGGPLQILAGVRRRFPAFHRLIGRVYVGAMVLTSLAGLYLVWVRGGAVGDLSMHLGISLDALFILAFAGLAVHTARTGRFEAHRRWALRLYLVGTAVWFFRISFSLWLMIHGRPVGFDPDTFTGPFPTIITFAQTLVPLGILELYLRARDGGSAIGRFATAGLLTVLTLLTAVGTFAAFMILWKPRIAPSPRAQAQQPAFVPHGDPQRLSLIQL